MTAPTAPGKEGAERPPSSAKGGDSFSLAGGHNPWLVAIVVSIATFMEVLDTSVANVALRYIAGDLAAGPDESTWVLTSYLVSNAIVLPISGWLATVIGRKRFYMGCVALFSLSSFLCGLAPSLSWLIVFRVFQGIGGGGLAPSEQSILADTFPPEKRGMAFALYGVAVVVAPAVGPTLGGYITDNYSWNWIFFINVPVGLLSLTLTGLVLKEPEAEGRRRRDLWRKGVRVDYVGFGLVAVGLGCLQVVLDKGERDDWFGSTFITTFAILSVVSLVLLIPWELTRDDPIVDLRLFADRGFAAACVVMFALGFILFGTTQLLPQFTQDLLGYTATLAGEVLTPGGFAVMILMPLVGVLLKKVQPRALIAFGLAAEGAALYHMSNFTPQISYTHAAWARVFQASAIAFLFVPITTVAYAGLSPEKNNHASALLNLMRNLGGSFGISACQTALAEWAQWHQYRLVEHLTPYAPVYQQRLPQIAKAVGAGPGDRRTFQALYQQVQQQVAMLTYVDIFFTLAWTSLGMVGLVFLLKKVKPGAAAAGH
jgi:DHA2 family multidrug resistance protein